MNSKHTPGPWFTKREGFSTVYVEARLRGSTIQEVAACGPTEAGSEQQQANARLIAAAPELLGQHEADLADLDLLLTAIKEGDPKPELLIRIADMTRRKREVIAKAQGERA